MKGVLVGVGVFLVILIAGVTFNNIMLKNTPSVEQAIHRCMEQCDMGPVVAFHYTTEAGASCTCGK